MPGDVRPITLTGDQSEQWRQMRRFGAAPASTTLPIWLPSSGFDPDVFTITGPSDTDHVLTYLPLGLNQVTLNGNQTLEYNVDFTVDYTTGTVSLITPVVAGNWLTVWYVTTGELIAQTLTPENDNVSAWSIKSNKAANVSAIDNTSVIDTRAAFVDVGADLAPGTGEISLAFGHDGTVVSGADLSFLFLRVTTLYTGGLWRFDRVGGVSSDTLLHSVAGFNVASSYAVSASGSVLSISKGGSVVDTYTLTGGDVALLSNGFVGISGTHGTSSTADNFTARGGYVTDSFNRPDADDLGTADTGQNWVSS